jgi:hypothetical protein
MNSIKHIEERLHRIEDHLRLCYNHKTSEDDLINFLVDKKHVIINTLAFRTGGEKVQPMLAAFYRGQTITSTYLVFNSLNQDFQHLDIPVTTQAIDQYKIQWRRADKQPLIFKSSEVTV